jgi:hypothetical protein
MLLPLCYIENRRRAKDVKDGRREEAVFKKEIHCGGSVVSG